MNISNLEKAAQAFSTAANQAAVETKNDILRDNIQTLSKEIMQYAGDRQNSAASCSAMINKASRLYDISKFNFNETSMAAVENHYVTLSKLATSVIHNKMMEGQADSSWLLDFLKLDKNIQKELLNDPQISQRFSAAISEAGPNLLLNRETRLTLFIRLAFDENPDMRKFTIELLKHKDLDIDQSMTNGNTALHAAAKTNDDLLIKELLAAGADPLKSNQAGKTPFDSAGYSRCRELFLKVIPFDTVVKGEPFGKQALKWACTQYLPETFDYSPFVNYIKSHPLDNGLPYNTEDWNINFMNGLLKQGLLIKGLPEDELQRCCYYCIEYESVEGLRTILNSGRLPFLAINKTDLLSAIESNNSLATALEKELKNVKSSLGEEGLQAYQSLFRNLAGNDTRRTIHLEAIDHDFQILIENKMPGAEKAKADFDDSERTLTQRKNLAEALQIFNEPVNAETKALNAVNRGEDVTSVLKQLAWMGNDNALLTELEKFLGFGLNDKFGEQVHAMNKIIANVALEKMYYVGKESYSGGKQNWVAPYFADALNNTQSKLTEANLSKELEPAQTVLKQCITEIQQQTRWTDYFTTRLEKEIDFDSNRLLQSKELVNAINSLPVGQSCLVPVTTLGHSTLMRIERTGEENVRILFYNTGQGVRGNHAEGLGGTYQTFIEYREVPIKNLQDPEKWTLLITGELRDMTSIYGLLKSICVGGKKQPASLHEEYYEAVQKSGSCAYQCYMAMIRERLISSLPNPVEGLGLYKAVKGMMLNTFEERTRAFLKPNIDEQLQSKLQVVGAELNIANALVDPSKRQNLLKELITELRGHHLEDLVEEIEQSAKAPSLVLFTVVRRAIDELTILDAPLTQNGLAKDAIMARRKKEDLGKQEYKKILDDYLNDFQLTPERSDQWAKVFATQYMGGTFQSTAVEWAVNNFNKIPKGPGDDDPRCVLLNRFVQGMRRQNIDNRESMLSPLLKAFANNPEMVAYLRKECLEPKTIQGPSGFEY